MGRFWENGDQDVESGVAPLAQEGAVIQCCGVVRREQGDTVLEFSIAGDSNVHPFALGKGKEKSEKAERKHFFSLACCSSLSGHFPQEHISPYFLRLGKENSTDFM